MTPGRFAVKSARLAIRDRQLNRPGRFETVRNRLTVLTVREDGTPGRFVSGAKVSGLVCAECERLTPVDHLRRSVRGVLLCPRCLEREARA